MNIMPILAAIAIYPTPKSIVELGGDFGTEDYVVVKKDDPSMAPQSYSLVLTNGVVEITAADSDGHFYARETLNQLGGNIGDRLPNLRIEDSPSIAVRGVVEGYYGRPWGKKGRLALLDFMGRLKLNTYIYGPKDDPYHHTRWREAYPEENQKEFKSLLAAAKRNHVRFCWAIHLGGSFRKGGEGEMEDFQALYAKLQSMYDLGIRSFAVFFDDFGDADAQFHAKICNFVSLGFMRRNEGCMPLIVCPNVYWGLGESDYCKVLGEELAADTQIVWTGKTVCHDISKIDAEKVAAAYRRPPFVWWNFPVNDYCRTKLLLGRTYGLDNGVEVSGFVANPMENCEANKIAIFGVADWCWNSAAFDSAKNWESAFGYIYPDPEVAAAMRILAAHNSDQAPNGQHYRREESIAVKGLFRRAIGELATKGELPSDLETQIRAALSELADACAVLKRKLPMEEPELWWEIEGWIGENEFVANSGLKLLDFLAAGGEKDKERLAMDLRRLKDVRKDNDARHVAKFAAATFPADAALVQPPRAATLVIRPFLDAIFAAVAADVYRAATGDENPFAP